MDKFCWKVVIVGLASGHAGSLLMGGGCINKSAGQGALCTSLTEVGVLQGDDGMESRGDEGLKGRDDWKPLLVCGLPGGLAGA